MKARRRHIPDSPECEQMPASGGGWIVGCDSYSFCFYCLLFIKDQFCAQRRFCWQLLLSPVSHLFKADQLPVLSSPALDEAHTDGAHPGELVHSLKALVD